MCDGGFLRSPSHTPLLQRQLMTRWGCNTSLLPGPARQGSFQPNERGASKQKQKPSDTIQRKTVSWQESKDSHRTAQYYMIS